MLSIESNKSEEYLDNVLTIKQFFNRHRNGGYIFAVSYSYPLKKEVDREVIDFCVENNLTIGELELKFDTERTCLEQLVDARKQFKNGLILTNVDELMLLTDDEFVYKINQMREALFSLHIPILIWLNPESHSSFTHKAIDLYSRRDLDTLFFPEINIENTTHLHERSEMRLGQYEDAEKLRTRIFLLEKQLEAAQNEDIPQSRVANEIVLPLAKAYRQLLLLEPALTLMIKYKNQFKDDNREVCLEFGELYYHLGKLDKSIKCFEQLLECDIKHFGEDSINVVSDYSKLGLAWKDKGNTEEAINLCEKALTISLKNFDSESENTGSLYNNLGTLWDELKDFDKSIKYYEQALSITLGVSGEESFKGAIVYNNLGNAWQHRGDFDKALYYYEKALSIRLKKYGELNPSVASTYNNIANLWLHKDDFDKSIAYNEKALSIILKIFNEETPNLATSYNNLGHAWKGKGDTKKSKAYFNKAYRILNKTYGKEHSFTKAVKEKIVSFKKRKI